MSKRFIDTEIWQRDWFMELTPAEKLAWVYLTTNCDNVGVWKPNFRLAEFVIGQQLDWEKFANKCNDNIEILENGKWWLVDFIAFQHPDLLTHPDGGNSKALQSYLRDLESHGLTDRFNALAMGTEWASGGHAYAPKAKERVKARVKAEEPRAKKSRYVTHPTLGVPMTQGWYDRIVDKWGRANAERYIEKVKAWNDANDAGTKDYAARAATFMDRDAEAGKLVARPKDEGPRTFAEAREMG